MTELLAELAHAGGTQAPGTHTARLRALLEERLAEGARELGLARSGRHDRPVVAAFGATGAELLAALPAPATARADPEVLPDRGWLVAAAAVGTLAELAGAAPAARAEDLVLAAGDLAGHLLLALPGRVDARDLDDLVPLAFEEQLGRVDRLRAVAAAVPAAALADAAATLRPILEPAHPLRVAEAVARLGGRPAADADDEAREDAVLALLGAQDPAGHRPHEDPDPGRRAARRILQRLNGMGKWGGYHTEFQHLARGFAGNEKALALAAGEALLAAGLLSEKPSVGQRHVFLNPRRAADIHGLIERGETPPGLRLP